MSLVRARTAFLLGTLAIAWSSATTQALPLFSRETNMACAHCHAGTGRLTPNGLAFALRGDQLASAHGDSLVGSRKLPVSLVATAGSTTARRTTTTSVAVPSSEPRSEILSVELHSRVRLGSTASIRLACGANEGDKRFEGDLAYLQLGESSRPAALDLKLGVFDSELPFFSPRLRPVQGVSLAPLNGEATGLALGARGGDWAGSVGLIDAERHPSGSHAEQVLRGLQDTYLLIAREQGDALFGARMLFDHQDSTLPSLRWMQHLKAEAGASLTLARLMLIPGYVLERFDDRPAAGMHERHQYALLEALSPLGQGQRWVVSARYEHEYRTSNAITREADRQLALADLDYDFSTGTRMGLEYSFARDNLGDPRVRSLDAFIRMTY